MRWVLLKILNMTPTKYAPSFITYNVIKVLMSNMEQIEYQFAMHW